MPNFIREIKRYKRQSTVVGGHSIVLDKPHPRSVSHLMDCLRYLMAAGLKYHKPEAKAEKAWWEDWVARRRKARGEDASVVYLAANSYTHTYIA
jgi:allantoicase